MVTPYNGSNISQTHHKISALGPMDVGRPNTIPYKSKNYVRTSNNDQNCKNRNELNSPKRRWGSKNAAIQIHNGSREATVAERWRQRQSRPMISSAGFWFAFWGKKVNLGEGESEMWFHMSANFIEGYHPLVSTPLSSVHKWPISHEHYRRINLSLTKKTTSYRHYWRINPPVMTTMDIRR